MSTRISERLFANAGGRDFLNDAAARPTHRLEGRADARAVATLRPTAGESAAAAALLLLLPLAACDRPADKPAEARASAERAALDNAEGRIVCAPPGAHDFAPVCGIDRTATQDGLFLTVRHPDGGFRRLLVTKDGRGVVAADGAEPALVVPIGPNEIEVAVGGARYRLPATVQHWKKP